MRNHFLHTIRSHSSFQWLSSAPILEMNIANNSMQDTLQNFNRAAKYARLPKVQRWMTKPVSHLIGFFLSYGLYRLTGAETTTSSKLFTGDKFKTPLPAGLDIYLTSLKSHDSELRMTWYLINHVKSDWTLIDIGAHIGFYTCVMARLAPDGQVHSFEPSTQMGKILKSNTADFRNVIINDKGVADRDGEETFLSFPAKYSEFNSIKAEAIDDELQKKASRVSINITTLDSYCASQKISPQLIKIDVEGAEFDVIKGAATVMAKAKPELIIELRKDSFDVLYKALIEHLESLGYQAYFIHEGREPEQIENVKAHILGLNLESDNVLFRPL